MKTYEGKRATAEWLTKNAPIGTVVLSHDGIKHIHQKDGDWRGNNHYAAFPLREDAYGYKIIRWGDPWDDLEWVEEP